MSNFNSYDDKKHSNLVNTKFFYWDDNLINDEYILYNQENDFNIPILKIIKEKDIFQTYLNIYSYCFIHMPLTNSDDFLNYYKHLGIYDVDKTSILDVKKKSIEQLEYSFNVVKKVNILNTRKSKITTILNL